jgi:hypothetical protein
MVARYITIAALGALLLVRPMSQNPSWRGLGRVSVALVVLALGTAVGLRGIVSDGLAQRIGRAVLRVVSCDVGEAHTAR